MVIEFTVTGLKATQRRRRKPLTSVDVQGKHAPGRAEVSSLVRTIVLAYQIEQAVLDGRAKNYAEVANQIGMTRARVSQIMRLLRWPPTLLESILLADPTRHSQLTERQLRSQTYRL